MHTQTHASTRIQRWGLIYAQALGRLLMVVCAPACLLAGARARAGGARACVRARLRACTGVQGGHGWQACDG